MPRKRQREKLAHRQLTWDDVDIGEQLAFTVGWSPPRNEFERSRWPWPTWEAFLTDWAAVRAEALPEWAASHTERLEHARAMVRQRGAELAEAEHDFTPAGDTWRDLHAELLEEAERWVAEEEAKAAPFAEVVYQRVLAGEPPEVDDGDD